MKLIIVSSFFVCLFLLGCTEEEQVVHYKVPKERHEEKLPQQQGSVQMQQVPRLSEQTAQFNQPQWEVPDVWIEEPLGSMRKGSFSVKKENLEAEITVLAFPGDVGGDLANINRWAGQIDAPLLESEEDLKKLQTIDVDGYKGLWIRLVGPSQEILAVIVSKDGDSWFFKMMGDAEIVTAEEDNFRAFVKSVRF